VSVVIYISFSYLCGIPRSLRVLVLSLGGWSPKIPPNKNPLNYNLSLGAS